MTNPAPTIFMGEMPQKHVEKEVQGEFVSLLGDQYYKISHYDAMEPFFISIVSSSDHWLFISSTGGVSMGRVSAESAIFPYYTVDKLTDNSENTGHKAILLVMRNGRTSLWEPFSDRYQGAYAIERSLYKNNAGTALVFEEINHDLGLTFRYAWRSGDRFGFIKTGWLSNQGGEPCRVQVLDGIQNLLPANVSSSTQNIFSSLLDAYKRSEVDPANGLAIFALNSTLTDLAEPSESLLATTAMQVGLESPAYLLSSLQVEAYRTGRPVTTETEVRGRRGAYFVNFSLELQPGAEKSWHLLVDTGQDAAAITKKLHWLRGEPARLLEDVDADIAAGQVRLWKLVASADGLQLSQNPMLGAHHFANVMFNLMRGGVFTDQYWIRAAEFVDFVRVRNRPLLQANAAFFDALPEKIEVWDLQARAAQSGSADLLRLSYAYLPLSFSRRHGDPSRPWNRFAINIKQPDGSLKLDYEGNWRDIFQNWEALAYAYPEFTESMISTFLNATTPDGYNPYRITHSGLDWEVPEPGNPWSNIGYWSDHQIIYLQKLMEISQQFHPGRLQAFLSQPVFTYASVPYRIKPYEDLLKDPYSTIEFNWELEKQVEQRVKAIGTDGKLVVGADGQVLRASLADKLLTLLLAKLVNFVPEGGIWMNTQRPEWNDANNALVGKGLSVVTLAYLRRYMVFCRQLFQQAEGEVALSLEVSQLFNRMFGFLEAFRANLQGSFSDEQRRGLMDALGKVGSYYRWGIYQNGLSGELRPTPAAEIVAFFDLALQYVEHSLRANRRADQLFHSYNILHIAPGAARVGHLVEMLEGQVAVLSSGLLNAEETLALLDSLRHSALYEARQHTYILYPDRVLPGFLQRNCLTQEQVGKIALFARLYEAQDRSLIVRDADGLFHFAGYIRNYKDVSRALAALKQNPRFASQVEADEDKVRALFEETFHHDEFTGRSGTFFAYEGLGSIYWHMVAKLLLAVAENICWFKNTPAAGALLAHYWDVRQGLGFNKSPALFGAFPADPYSHTPKDQGAKQPGMTGLVKEEILTRQAELGYFVEDSRLVFNQLLLDASELLTAPAEYSYLDVRGQRQVLALPAGALAYTICQTPVILLKTGAASITVHSGDGQARTSAGSALDSEVSRHIFLRDGQIHHLIVTF